MCPVLLCLHKPGQVQGLILSQMQGMSRLHLHVQSTLPIVDPVGMPLAYHLWTACIPCHYVLL